MEAPLDEAYAEHVCSEQNPAEPEPGMVHRALPGRCLMNSVPSGKRDLRLAEEGWQVPGLFFAWQWISHWAAESAGGRHSSRLNLVQMEREQ